MNLPRTSKETVWNPKEVATIVGGRWIPELSDGPQITGITFKLENLKAGQLFFTARPDVWGAKFPATGRKLARVAAAGATGAVIDEPALLQSVLPLPVLLVGNTLEALHALAVAARRRYAGKVIAVTGTVGKTSVCRMLEHVLGRQGATASFIGARNYLPGLRAAMCSMEPDFRFAVFELNMMGRNSIAPKSRLLQADLAVVTALGLAHLEHHDGSMESVVQTKGGVLEGLREGGACVLPRDSRWYDLLADKATKRGLRRQLSFGEHPEADVRVTGGDFGPGGSDFEVQVCARSLRVRLTAPGRHVVMNCLAMLAAVQALEGDVPKAASDIADWQPPAGRCRITVLPLAGGDAHLIDATHNANPDSMRAAMDLLGMVPPGDGGRKLAVLADMMELGEISGRCHEELAAPLLQSGADRVFTLGQQMQKLRQALPEGRLAPHFNSVEELGAALESTLHAGDVVMIQGSRATRINEAAEQLRALERSSELLIYVNDRRVLRDLAIDTPRFPASLVKLMTLYQVFSALDGREVGLNEKIRASARATHLHPQSSILGLAEGDFLTIEDVIRGLIVQSANDAAICVAEHLAGSESEFVRGMNRQAQALGLRMTSFANASGEHSKGNQTTAREMATIALSIIDRFPRYLVYFAETEFQFNGRVFPPRNRLIRTYNGLQGMKTGHVPASGYHLVALAQRGQHRLLSVVMGAHNQDARDRRTERLLDYGFEMCRAKTDPSG
jgi:UDP-N-acetylmuramoyl-tripeptide--D-alanyl-D-alanine ligase